MKIESTNPVYNISDPAAHLAAWERFIQTAGEEGRKVAERNPKVLTEIGRTIRRMELTVSATEVTVFNDPQDVLIVSIAYYLRLHEKMIFDFATALVAVHHPRTNIFDMTMLAKFGLEPTIFLPKAVYITMRRAFDDWLDTFGDSVLRPAPKCIGYNEETGPQPECPRCGAYC